MSQSPDECCVLQSGDLVSTDDAPAATSDKLTDGDQTE